MKKFFRTLLIKLLGVTTKEVEVVVKETIKKNWPSISNEAILVVDGLEYIIKTISDKQVEALLHIESKRRLIKVNLEDMEYDSHAKVWRLPGR